MSSRKSKKRIGSTRQRHFGHKAEEKEDNEQLQECSTTHHLQLSTEMPKSQLGDIENVESDQHDTGKTSSEKLVVPAELCEAETSTSGKKKRIGSTRRAKQGFQTEERKEEEEHADSMPVNQEELNVTRAEDQYLQEKSDAPELAQAHLQLLELGGSEVRELTKKTSDESPNEKHSLLSKPDLKTEAGTCSTEIHSYSQSFSQNLATAVNPPVCVTDPYPEEAKGIHKQNEQSFFNLFEAKDICSNSTPFQNPPQGLDLQKDQNADDVRKYDEQRGAKEVTLEISLDMETTTVDEDASQHLLHEKGSQEEMQIKKVGNEPLGEMGSAGNQFFSLQMKDMPHGSSSPTTAESISMIKEDFQIFQPSNTKTDGTVMESYEKSGIENSFQTEQSTSICLSQEEDKDSEHNVQKPKKRMGSTRKHIKGLKMTEDTGSSQVETQDMKEKTFQGLKLTEESVEENTHFRIMTAFNDKLETAITVSERGAESEGAGDESEEQRNAKKDQILDENTEGAMATMDNKTFHSTENITDGSWVMESSSITCFVMEGNLDHHTEIDSEGGRITNQDQRSMVEILPPGVLGEQLSEQMSIQTYHTLDEQTLQSRTPQDNAIQDTHESELIENAHFTLEFTHSYSHSFGGTEDTAIDKNKITKGLSPLIAHREEKAGNPLDMQCESFIHDCPTTGKSDTEATEKAENITNKSEKEIPSNTFSFFEVADHFKGVVMREDVDQLQRHDEEKCPELPEDRPGEENSTNMEVLHQEQVKNQLSSLTEDPSPDYAGTTVKDTDAIKDTKPFFPQSETDILSESVDPLEHQNTSPAPEYIQEITDVTTNVHLESSSPEMYSPDVQHREDTEQGTQPHVLSSTMEPEVPNNSTDVSDGLHSGQNKQSACHSHNLESKDMSETSTLSDHSESTFKLQHSEEEKSVKQRRKMGSTRRIKRDQQREETCDAVTTDEDHASEDINVQMNTDTDIRAEEGILDAGITNVEVSEQAEFQNNLSYPTKNPSQDCAGMRVEDVGVTEKTESLFCEIGVGNLTEASGPSEQEHPTSPPAPDYTPEIADVPFIVHAERSSPETYSPDVQHREDTEQWTQPHVPSSTMEPEAPNISTDVSDGLHSGQTEQSASHSHNLESKDMSETSTLSDHSELTFKLQHSKEQKSVKQRRKMGSTRRIKRDQQREETCDAMTTDEDHASEDVIVQMNTDTDIIAEEGILDVGITNVEVSEQAEFQNNLYPTKNPARSVGNLSEALGSSEQEHPMSPPAPDYTPEIADVPLIVHAKSSSPEMYSPDVQHREETEQGTQPHTLSSTMEPEAPDISTDVSDGLHSGQTEQSASHSHNLESTDMSETSTLSDHSELTFKLQHSEEEKCVKQRRKMGSTRRIKRDQQREETCDAMTTDEDHASEDVNVQMNTNTDIRAEEGILDAGITNVEVSEQAEFQNNLSYPTKNPSQDCAGMRVEDVGVTEKTESLFCEIGVGNLNEASGPSEQKHPMSPPAPDYTPEIADVPLIVHADRSSPETYSPDVQHREDTEQGTQPHTLSSTMEPEAPDISTDVSDGLHSGQTEQSASHSHNLESTDMSETSTLSDHSELTFKLQHSEEEKCVKQRRKMGSTRRIKRDQQREETCDAMTTDEDHASEDVNVQMNTNTDIRAEEGILDAGITNVEVSEQAEFQNNLSYPTKNPSQDCAGMRVEDVGVTEKTESLFCEIGVGNLNEASGPSKQEHPTSPPAPDYTPEIADVPFIVHAERSSPETYSPDVQHREDTEQGTQPHVPSSTMEPEAPNISTDVSDGLHSGQTEQSASHSHNLESKDMSETSTLSDHSELTFKLQHSEEQKSVKQRRKMGSTRRIKRDQQREETCDAMTTDEDHASEDVIVQMNTDTDIIAEEGILDVGITNVEVSEQAEFQNNLYPTKNPARSVGNLSEALGSSEQEHPMSPPAPDYTPEIADVPLIVHAKSSSPEMYSPDVQHREETEQGTQPHTLSSTMEPEAPDISTDVSDGLHSGQTEQSASHSHNLESTDMSETSTLSDHSELTFKLQHSEEEKCVKQRRKMGSTRRIKRDQQREETCDAMTTDEDHASEDVNVQMNTNTDIRAEEGILDAGITNVEVSEQAEFQNNLSYPTKNPSQDCAGMRVEGVGVTEKTESLFCEIGVGNLNEASGPSEQEHPTSPPAPDYTPEIADVPFIVHAERSSPETYSPDVQHREDTEQGTQPHVPSSTMEPEAPNISTDVSDGLHSGQTEQSASHSHNLESKDMSETSTLSDHSELTFKLQHSEEQKSVKQRRKMGSTRRIKRDQQREETCDAMTTDEDHASEDVIVQMNTDTDIIAEEGILDVGITNVEVSEQAEFQNNLYPTKNPARSVGNLSEALGSSEQEHPMSPPAPDYTPEIADVPLIVHAKSSSPEMYSPDVQHREETEQGTQPHTLSSSMEPEVSNNGIPQASESQQDAETYFLSHSFNIESSGIAETRALSDNCDSPLGFQYHENEGSLKSSMSKQKRKIGSTRKQKRESNEVKLDEGTRSPHETEEKTTEGIVIETVEIEVQQQENLQSERISSCENIQSACLNTIPVEGGLNEYQPPLKDKETVDESKTEYGSTQEQDKIQDQVKNTIPEMSVSASQYPETEESPSLTRRKKLSSTRRHGRGQQENTERKYVVMDGMLIYTDAETSSCHASKSVDREINAFPCISVNTMVSPPTPELLKTDQESGGSDLQSKDELTEEHQYILSSTVTTSEQEILEGITSNQNLYSSHEDTQANKPVCSVTPPVDSLSSENTLRLTPLENSDSTDESKPRKKRMGSSRKRTHQQHITGKNENNGEGDVKIEVSDDLTITAKQPLQLETRGIDTCATDKQGLECTHIDEWTDNDQRECSETASGPHNQPEGHSVTGIYDQSPSGQIVISESSGTTAYETSVSKLNDDNSQNPKSMLQKRKMGSSRKGQGLGNRMKGEAAKVEDDTITPRQEENDTTHGALLQNEEGSKQKDSCLVSFQNMQDLSVELEELYPALFQSTDSCPQSVAQAEGPDESTDERMQPASNPSTDPQTSVMKKKMGSTRKNMRRKGEEEKIDPRRDQSPERSVDDTAWDSTICDVLDLITVPTETVMIQKITPSQEPKDTLLKDESSENGSAAKNESLQDVRRKLSSRSGGKGLRAPPEEPEDQHVSKGPENDSSISKGRQENIYHEGVDVQGLSKLGLERKVEQPAPLGARIKSDLEKKYGQGDTLTSLDEAVLFNVVMVGESSVGKTSFIRRFQSGQFFVDHSATIGVDTFIQTLSVDGKLVKLQIWDTAGQERFHSITRQVLHKAQGLILMYDISSCETFSAVRKWISCIEEGASTEVIILLLGNKNDSEERQVLPPEGERLAQEYNIHFMECSAVTGHNVTHAMETMARLLQQAVKETDKGNVTLHKKPQQKSGCC